MFILLLAFLIHPSISRAQVVPCIPATGPVGSICEPSTGIVPGTGGGVCTLVGGEILCIKSTPVGTVSTGGATTAQAEAVCPSPLPTGWSYIDTNNHLAGCCLPGYITNHAGHCVQNLSTGTVGTGTLFKDFFRDVTLKILVADGTTVHITDNGTDLGDNVVYNNTVVLKDLSVIEHDLVITAENYKPLYLTIAAVTSEVTPTPPAQAEQAQPGFFTRIWYAILDFFGLSSWHNQGHAPQPPTPQNPPVGKIDLRTSIVIADATGTYQQSNVLGPNVVTGSLASINCPASAGSASSMTPGCFKLNVSGTINLTALVTPLVEIPNATFQTWAPALLGGSSNILGCTSPVSSYNVLTCPMTVSRNIQAVYRCNADSIATYHQAGEWYSCEKNPQGGKTSDLKVKVVLESPNLTYHPVVAPQSTVTSPGIINCPSAVAGGATSLATQDCYEANISSSSSVNLTALATLSSATPNAHFVRWENIPLDPTIGKTGCGANTNPNMSCPMTAHRDIQAVYRCDEGSTASLDTTDPKGSWKCNKPVSTACTYLTNKITDCGVGLQINRDKQNTNIYTVTASPASALTTYINPGQSSSSSCANTFSTSPTTCAFYSKNYSTSLTLTATSSAGSLPTSFKWYGGGACNNTSSPTCIIPIAAPGSISVIANFVY